MKKPSQKKQKPSMPVLKNMLALSLSGLSLLAALAWNNSIQEITNNFIKNYIEDGAGIISFLLYAVFVAILFAITGKQLAGFLDKMETEQENEP